MMFLEKEMNIDAVTIDALYANILTQKNIAADVLRLDKIHAVVSGNKWFKLKYYLREAEDKNYRTIATFGGAFSNHILATAYACNKQNIECIGFIRGEEPKHYSQTLNDAKSLNMQLRFVSRDEYNNKQNIIANNNDLFFIPEGGYGKTGAKGAAEILNLVPNLSKYKYIICAVGTSTMLAGITNTSLHHQQCVGISVMKNNYGLNDELRLLLNDDKNNVTIMHDYHFGGYAKHTQTLIDFMNDVWKTNKLPLDFVYTAKALYGIYDLAEKNYFDANSNVLFIHSGGLQGNRSLQDKLMF